MLLDIKTGNYYGFFSRNYFFLNSNSVVITEFSYFIITMCKLINSFISELLMLSF